MRASIVLFCAALLLTGGAGASAAPQGPQFRATLSADGHRPAAGARWRFAVRAADPQGRPVRGVAIVRVLVRGRVVDTIGWFRFRGTLRRSYRWSAQLQRASAVVQAKVMGPGSARTVRYAVRVRSDWAAKTGRPTFRTMVTGRGRAPRAGARWPFVVRAVDRNGRPVGGTAVVRIVVPGRMVDTIGWFVFRGTLRRTYRWSPRLRGTSALFEVKVVGPGGTRTAAYRVRVR